MGKLKAWGEWYLTSGRVASCDECPWQETIECQKCAKPSNLLPENILSWEAWLILSKAGREGMSGIMTLSEITSYLSCIGGDREDLDKILILEEIFQSKREGKTDGRS